MEALTYVARSPRGDALRTLLLELCESYGLEAIVMADEDGFLMGTTATRAEGERLAAWAPARLLGSLPVLRKHEAPTVVRAIRCGREAVLLGAVGDPAACRTCLEEADPWVRALLDA